VDAAADRQARVAVRIAHKAAGEEGSGTGSGDGAHVIPEVQTDVLRTICSGVVVRRCRRQKVVVLAV
jgi:hypothetical protein